MSSPAPKLMMAQSFSAHSQALRQRGPQQPAKEIANEMRWNNQRQQGLQQAVKRCEEKLG
eukprot:1149897-Pelagomonas_calceolata.AAC.4